MNTHSLTSLRRRTFLLTLGLSPLAGCLCARTPSPASTEPFRGLEALLPQLLAEFNVPGAAIACVRDGRTVWSGAFGLQDASRTTPVDHATLFEAASVSKTVFAYAALKMVEQGIFALDTPLVRYTAAPFISDDPRIEQITARQVLSHSSGFADWRSSGGPLIQSEPGTKFEYSGEGYYYLQSVLTHLAGRVDPAQCARYEADFEVCATDFDPFMKRRLLLPFGMKHSGYLADVRWPRHAARGHDSAGQPLPKHPPRGSDVARYGAVGGLNTTAREYARFLAEIVAPRPPGPFRLHEALRHEMLRPQIALPRGGEIDGCTHWALGWGVQQRPSGNLLVHSGGQAGFRSLALASVEHRSGLIILTNSDNGGSVLSHPDFLTLADQIIRQT